MITGFGVEYSNQIASIPDITKEQEHDLFTRLRKNEKELKRICKLRKCKSRTARISFLIEDSNSIKNEIVRLSQKTAYLISRQYFKYVANSTVCDESDLIQEAVMVMMDEVIPRFELKRNLRLSTYAYWWIRQRITKYLENTHAIKVPHSYIAKAKKDISMVMPQVVSYEGDKFHGDSEQEESRNILDYIKDEKTSLFIEEIELKFLKDIFDDIFLAFTPKEVEILKLRFGFNGQPQTLAEVGEVFLVTRERVRQIEEKAIARIRKKYGDILSDFLYKE